MDTTLEAKTVFLKNCELETDYILYNKTYTRG